MADTQPLAPTDAEIDAFVAAYLGDCGPQATRVYNYTRAVLALWGSPPPKGEPMAWNGLTDEDRERAMNSMPGMLEGFTKTWGWLHFAKAIEAICREKNAQPAPASRLEIESMRGRSVPVSEADMVLAAMETGEWELQRLLPQTCFTSEANIRNAWSVKRSAAPYCTKDGLRTWTGATPLEALCNGAAALGVELPGCSETAALPKTVVAILGEQAELRRLSECCPELNLSNYGHDDVDELNGWAIEVSQCIDRALAAQPAGAQQPAPSAAAHKACKPDMLVNAGALKLALNVLRRAGKHEVADELEKTAQAAPTAVAGPWSAGELDGNWLEIDHKDHAGAIRIVWKMEGDARSPVCEARAMAVIDALNAYAAPAQPAGAQQPIGSNNGFTAPQTESQPVPVPRWDEMIRQQFPDMPPKGWSDTLIRRYMTRELDAYRAARAPAASGAAPSQQVIVDFAQVGTAGPFAVVDGRVSLPDATMQDLVHMLRPTFNAQAADSVLEDAARYRYLRDVPMDEWPDELAIAFRLQQNAIWDTAIDAARKQGANHD